MKTRDDGLRVSGQRFEYAPKRWLGRDTPREAVRFLGLQGVTWDVAREYLLWLGVDSWLENSTPGDYVADFEAGQAKRERERAKRAEVFARIESEAPDVAALMRAVRQRFGPGSCVGAEVVLNGQTVLPVAEASDE